MAAALLTLAAGAWGAFRGAGPEWPLGWIGRGLSIGSLATLAAFVLQARRADERQPDTDRQFEHLVSANGDYAFFTLDEHGDVTSWNAGAERLKGYGADEILGEPFARFFSAEDIAAGVPGEVLTAARRDGRAEDQGWRVRRDGSRFFADVVILALRTGDGALQGYSKLVRDVTARKLTEDKLTLIESRCSALLDSAPDGIAITDGDGRILMVNAETERLFGYGRDDLLGRGVEILVPERFRDRHPQHRAAYSRSPHRRSMGEGRALWGLRRDGTEFPVEISLSPTETPEGTLITNVIRDVTARKAAEASQRLGEERRRMAVEVAHMGTWTWKIAQDEITWSDEFRALFGLSSDRTLTYDEITRHIHPDDLSL